jgi:hypothetical protein
MQRLVEVGHWTSCVHVSPRGFRWLARTAPRVKLCYTLNIRVRMYQPRRGSCSAAGVECLRKQDRGFTWARLLKRSRLSSCSSRPCANHGSIGPPGLANIFDHHKDLSSLAVRIADVTRQLVLDVWGVRCCVTFVPLSSRRAISAATRILEVCQRSSPKSTSAPRRSLIHCNFLHIVHSTAHSSDGIVSTW